MNLSKISDKIIESAIDTAKNSDMRCKHACIVVDKKGNIITSRSNKSLSVSNNILTSKDFDKSTKVSRHAEENALRNTDPKKLKDATLYVIRLNINDNTKPFLNSKPCCKCTKIIHSCMRKYGLKKVFYSS